jgi:aspartate/methionine/tyrosine aminotransferase
MTAGVILDHASRFVFGDDEQFESLGYTLRMRPLRPFALEVFLGKWEFTARYHLCASDMQSMTLSELLAMADPADRAAWDQLYLGYTETWGAPSLRETIASTYDTVSAEQVLTFVGAQEGIFAAMHALLGPDDHAITVIPNYQSVESVPLSLCETTGIALDPQRNWELDLDQVRDAIRPNTRVVCINFPHNPTGKVISRQTLDSLISMCRERGIYLFSDEVYRLLERRPEMTLPQVADAYEKGLSLGVMSKAYGLPGLRMGWIASKDVALLQRMERVKHYTSICSPAPSELLTQIALKAREKILARNRALIERNLPVLGGFFREHARLFEWSTPDGGSIGFPRYLGGEGVEAFAADLVENAGVLLLPGSVYRSDLGETPNDRFRIGYGRANMAEGVAAMGSYLGRKRASQTVAV